MEYFLLIILAFATGFLITEAITRRYFGRIVTVYIRHKDGTRTPVQIRRGRDREVDALIDAAKKGKSSAVHP